MIDAFLFYIITESAKLILGFTVFLNYLIKESGF